MKNIFSVILLFISITSFAQLPTLPQKQVLHLSDSLAKKVDSSIIRNDSLFQYKNGFEYFRGKIIGSGATDTSHLSLRIDSMQRFADLIDIRAFRGVADGLTDNQPAMLAAKASAPAGALIWLKMRGTGIYYFNNTDTSLFNNTKIYCEEGVVIKLSTENLHSLNSVTPVKVVLGSLNNQDMMYYPQDPNIEHVDNEPIRDNVIIRYPVQGTLFTEHQTSNWAQLGGEPLVVDATKITADSNHFTLSSANSPGNGMKVGIIDAVPGATLTACARNSNAWALMWVENSWGYMVCYGGFTVQIRKFGDPNTGIGSDQLNINGLLNNPTPYLNYGTDKAICSMRLSDDGRTIEFLHNGVNRNNHQFTLGGQPITKWGFGAYGAGVSTVSWYDFIMEYNRKQPAANETVHVQVFGDSQVGYFQGSSWLKYFQQYLDNSYGYKIDTLENYAVSGETMEQQKTRFDAVTHKGVTIVLAGTNNIQAQSSLTTMITTLNGMVDSLNYTNNLSSSTVGVLNPGNKKLIVCIPPMFYSYALNGNKGKASSNYELGGAYRMAILRWAASRNVMVVDLPSVMGPTTQRAALLRDDIHPSDLGAAVIGREVAKKYIALVSGTIAASVFVVKDNDTVFVRGIDTANAKMANYLKIQKNGIILNAIGDTLGVGSAGTVTSIAAGWGTNFSTITTAGSITVDSILVTSRWRLQHVIDSLGLLIGSSGVNTMAAIGSSPNANGATISGSTLNLQPASASFGGVVTTGTQHFAGSKIFDSSPSSPGAGSNSERFGSGATAGGLQGVAIGYNANGGNSDNNTVIGASSTSASGKFYNTVVGSQSTANHSNVTIVGKSVTSSSDNQTLVGGNISSITYAALGYGLTGGSVNIGSSNNSGANGTVITIGNGLTATAQNQLLIGSSDNGWAVNDVYIGGGVTNANATNASVAYRGTGGSGTNIAGADVTIHGGKSTGSANGGKVSIYTTPAGGAGSSLNSEVEQLSISSSGVWKMGTAPTTYSTGGYDVLARNQTSGNVEKLTLYNSTATSITLTDAYNVVEVTATGQTITLPTAVGISGKTFTIKLTASGSATVATTSSQTIDGSTTYSLASQYKYVTVQSNGANWIIIANN
jgi:lysophospholipase L1-like esterase